MGHLSLITPDFEGKLNQEMMWMEEDRGGGGRNLLCVYVKKYKF